MTDITIRSSQVIIPFGVGGIYTADGQSFIAKDTSTWKKSTRFDKIECDRLSDALGVREFLAPPQRIDYGSSLTLPYMRFPLWLFCPKCRRMIHWAQKDEKGQRPTCTRCTVPYRRPTQLVPMRFIEVCQDGHIQDVDWFQWAHSQSKEDGQKQCQMRDELEFQSGIRGGIGLGSLYVKCRDCKAERSLERIADYNSMNSMVRSRCWGQHPWQRRRNEAYSCDATPQVVQAGASNVYFPIVRSAIDIPPEKLSDGKELDNQEEIKKNDLFSYVKEMRQTSTGNNAIEQQLIEALARTFNVSTDTIEGILAKEISDNETSSSRSASSKTEQDLLEGEWRALIDTTLERHESEDFFTKHVDLSKSLKGTSLGNILEMVVRVEKLREVRALVGFSRYERATPEDQSGRFVSPSLGKRSAFLPAVEVYGEGIFLSFSEGSIKNWEKTDSVTRRLNILQHNNNLTKRASWLPDINPRFVMLHTLSHLLIRELVAQSGYGAASLRERIYASSSTASVPMGGILIYTASGDSEGTMGGLVRQGSAENIEKILKSALNTGSWCSNDPICSERNGQGIDSLNLAACHACCLLPETSCIYGNCLLDRALVINDGFFEKIL